MDLRQQGQRPATRPVQDQQASQDTAQPSAYYAQNGSNQPSKKSSKKVIAALVVAALLVVAGFVGWEKFAPTPGVDTSKYQAVFLDNDQVYFGKIKDISDDTLVLTNIYYLQQAQSASSKPSVNQATGTKTADQANLSLVKLGEELHGPQDEMHVNRDQVIFWENLKDNGKVAEAIKNYKK